jgi:alpha-amylase
MLSSLRPFATRALALVAPALVAPALVACGGGGTSTPTGPPLTQPPAGRPLLPTTYRASGHAAAGDVSVHLFEWRWNDIASECEAVLGPAATRPCRCRRRRSTPSSPAPRGGSATSR